MNTALLAAAGKGSRYFGYPHETGKSHIRVFGYPLFTYLLPELRKAGIERIVINVNRGHESDFKSFERFFDVSFHVEPVRDTTSFLPYILEDRLPSQYFFVYGHQPILASHLERQASITDGSSMSVSLYDWYEESKQLPVVLDSSNRIRFVDPTIEQRVAFIAVPWILLGPEFAKLARDDDFRHWPGYYMKEAQSRGIPITGVQAEMPVEFDFPWQLPSVEEFLARQLAHSQHSH